MTKLNKLKSNLKFIISKNKKKLKFCYLNFSENIKYKIVNFDSTPYIQNIQLFLSFIIKYSKISIGWISSHKGLSIFFSVIILYLYTGELGLYALWGSILYAFTLIVYMIHYKIDKEQLDRIDLEYFNKLNITNGEDNILDNYVDDCFKRYLILFEGYRGNGYINSKQENAMLKGLIESVSSNLSPLLIKKLEMYYGKDRVGNILAEKCYIKITIYVASQNKNIYSESTNTSDYINEMMK